MGFVSLHSETEKLKKEVERMKKIVVIGECALQITLTRSSDENNQHEAKAGAAGWLLNAAALLGKEGMEVEFMGETGRDFTGDMIIDFLEENHVGVKSIDRYTDGQTAVNLCEEGKENETICLRNWPEEDWDDVWPRVEKGDAVVFGQYFSINHRTRKRLREFLKHAADLKALIVYVPGFERGQSRRITHEMPMILENLEQADLTITRTKDLENIFGNEGAEGIYKRNIGFYSRSLINIDLNSGELTFFNGSQTATGKCENLVDKDEAEARILARLIKGLVNSGMSKEDLDMPSLDSMAKLVNQSE